MSISGHFRSQLGEFKLDAEFSIPGAGITGLFGPSGCGKTSLLRAIAGLDFHPDGQLRVSGTTWQDRQQFLAAHLRPVAYVFQEANLFSHLDVQSNLEYGWHRLKPGQRRISLPRIIELLELGSLARRKPDSLSGGERQRVAIGRALAVSPELLLMDEPLASLDQRRRSEILPYLESLQREFSLPVIHVSHDQDEISRLADHLLLMEAGRIVASDRCQELLTRLDLPLAHASSAGSAFDAVAVAADTEYQLTTFRCGSAEFILPGTAIARGTRARLVIASRDVSLAVNKPEGSSILNIIPTRIDAITTAEPGRVTVRLLAGDLVLLSRITSRSADQLGLQQGMQVFAQVKSIALSGLADNS